MISVRRTAIGLLGVLALALGACGDDSSATTGPASTDEAATGTAPSTQDEGGTTAATQSGGGTTAGFITIGDETTTFDSTRCFLQAQGDGAGGQILATAQGFGTNAAGEPVSADFNRFSEDSQFAGDDISVTVGDPYSSSSYSFETRLDLGTVSVAGDTVSADGFALQNLDDFSEVPASLRLDC